MIICFKNKNFIFALFTMLSTSYFFLIKCKAHLTEDKTYTQVDWSLARCSCPLIPAVYAGRYQGSQWAGVQDCSLRLPLRMLAYGEQLSARHHMHWLSRIFLSHLLILMPRDDNAGKELEASSSL